MDRVNISDKAKSEISHAFYHLRKLIINIDTEWTDGQYHKVLDFQCDHRRDSIIITDGEIYLRHRSWEKIEETNNEKD